MNDEQLKALFKSIKYEAPSELEIARWRRIVRREITDRSSGEWLRLVAACLIGILVGATTFKKEHTEFAANNIPTDATIERVYVNLQ